MSNFCQISAMIDRYLIKHDIDQNIKSSMHNVSANDCNANAVVYLYNGEELEVIDMDAIAKNGYKRIRKPSLPSENPINSADAFLVNSDNEWFFIEFKDAAVNDSKTSIIKKAYSNWYMLMDVLYEMKGTDYEYSQFDFDNPVRFAQQNVSYIVVCSAEKNPQIYLQIKNQDLVKQTYTPPFLERVKTYIFKDAYLYTEILFERKFARNFRY